MITSGGFLPDIFQSCLRASGLTMDLSENGDEPAHSGLALGVDNNLPVEKSGLGELQLSSYVVDMARKKWCEMGMRNCEYPPGGLLHKLLFLEEGASQGACTFL